MISEHQLWHIISEAAKVDISYEYNHKECRIALSQKLYHEYIYLKWDICKFGMHGKNHNLRVKPSSKHMIHSTLREHIGIGAESLYSGINPMVVPAWHPTKLSNSGMNAESSITIINKNKKIVLKLEYKSAFTLI